MNLQVKQYARKVVLCGALIGVAVAAYAASPAYKKGSPKCVDNGSTATCTGSITGLGNGDILVILSFPNAVATTSCLAPGSLKPSPGQNPAISVSVTGTASYPDPKNGNLSFVVSTIAPTTPTWDQVGCQNSNWGVRIDNVTFGEGTLTVKQTTDGTIYSTVIGPTSVFLP
jgi:hypothetical protein